MLNPQFNKELRDKLLEQLEKDKILEEYYTFIKPNKEKQKEKRKTKNER